MRIIRGVHNLPGSRAQGCVATIGNFDGVHRGHQAIVQRVCERARELGLPACVMVFEPQPLEFFAPDAAPARLMRFRDKVEALRALGVDQVVCLQFNRRLRDMSALTFIERVLVRGLGVRHLVVGDDFRFGCDRSGDFAMLAHEGALRGFTVEATPTVLVEGARVSSTRVRDALAAGDFGTAERLLGRPYTIAGKVMHGRKLGRTLDVPTANVALARRQSPLRGVYVVEARAGDRIWQGVANVGKRPTVSGVRQQLEVHLFGFSGDLYGRRLETRFWCKIRDEHTFDSVQALQAAIHADIAWAHDWFSKHSN